MQGVSQYIKCACVGLAMVLAGCAPQPSGNVAQSPSGAITYTPPSQDGGSSPAATQAGQPTPAVTQVVRVGLLVPLSGRNADLGKAMQDAATLALYDKYAALSPNMASTRVEILPKDTGDSPEMAALAAEEAIKDGAVVLIGPIFSDAVQAVKPVAKRAGKQVISFSNNKNVAAPGVYTFGFSPEEQAERVISYAISQRMQVGAMVPNSPFGTTVLASAKNAAAANKASLSPVSTYMPNGMGAAQAVEALQSGETPFNALFIPEVGDTLDTLLTTLSARGLNASNTQFLGTGLWDDPAVISRHSLEGALLASSNPSATQGFINRFRNAYGYTPQRISSLAYDAVALSVTLATSGRSFDADTLTSPGGFSGPANGIFRFRKNGFTDRGLAVMRVRGGGYEVVSPPPATFR